MMKIDAKIIADSKDKRGNRITSMILTYPRFIHSELMTHRMFSRNAASSRAIPFVKMVKSVREEPFIPVVWQRGHKGMQGKEYFNTPGEINTLRTDWEETARYAAASAEILHNAEVTKQICNRILEPFLWYTVLVTATEWDNFFNLRLPKYVINGKTYKTRKDAMDDLPYVTFKDWNDTQWMAHSEAAAEPHMQMLAEAIYTAMQSNTPKELKDGEWHIPFGDKMDGSGDHKIDCKISVARCARISYMTYDGEYSIKKDIALHDTLLKSRHMSPFEHLARCMTEDEYVTNTKYELGWCSAGWSRNFRGFIQYRAFLENNYNNEI